jgi:hypothetical protein
MPDACLLVSFQANTFFGRPILVSFVCAGPA